MMKKITKEYQQLLKNANMVYDSEIQNAEI